MLLLYDVQRVGAGDAVEFDDVFVDPPILRGVDVFVAQLNEFSTFSAPWDVVLFQVTDESCLLHCETSCHYITLKKCRVVN